jgi:1,4-dihydroxy-2-naphthoate octaprenyltransferase
VDVVSNNMFPPDFGGWKILPRGLMSFGGAKRTAYFFFILAAGIGLGLVYLRGPIVLLLGLIGLFFAYFHVAPPLKLGYRGLGLGELGILVAFGILPVTGSFYVQASNISPLPGLIGLALGLLTTCVLMNHDQIFFEAYQKSGKRSLTVTIGRDAAYAVAFTLTLVSYLMVIVGILARLVPATSGLVLLTLPLYFKQIQLYKTPARSPLHYVKLTQATFALSVSFGFLLTLGLIVG